MMKQIQLFFLMWIITFTSMGVMGGLFSYGIISQDLAIIIDIIAIIFYFVGSIYALFIKKEKEEDKPQKIDIIGIKKMCLKVDK